MDCLNKTIALIEQGKMDREINRKQAIASLEALIAQCGEAINVWQEYLKSPGSPGDKWSVLSWVGPQRAKRLHEIGLEAKTHMMQACLSLAATGGHIAALEDGVVVSAYGQLMTGQTGADAGKAAVQQMQQDIKHLGKVIERIKSAPAVRVKKPATVVASKAKKPAAKKVANRKKPAPKKTSKKPPVKKSSVTKKKPAGKKKPVVQKKSAGGTAKGKKKAKKR
jgi:hypothetical protein